MNLRRSSAPLDVSQRELANLIGESPRFLYALDMIRRMARFDAPVLIQGETGTGKELAARAIHYLSARGNAPFVPLNCGAVPESLIETELFGCERGAYTDARRSRAGLAAAAEGGTLFLDEVDALPARAQVALLRFLQEHVFRPVGATREQSCNVRVIAAASTRLAALLRAGSFRDDLAFRLNVLMLEMPPLRERGDDALLLAEHFMARHAHQHGLTPSQLSAQSTEWIAKYAWPGNVRELDNLVQRALLLADGPTLHLHCDSALAGLASPSLPATRNDAAADGGALRRYGDARAETLHHFEQEYLHALMTAAAGNVSHAARLAGKERRALGKLLKRHGINRLRFEAGSA